MDPSGDVMIETLLSHCGYYNGNNYDKKLFAEKVSELSKYSAMDLLGMTEVNPAIVIIGSESSGKSTIINCMMGEDIAPSSVDRTTKCAVSYRKHDTVDGRILVKGNVVDNIAAAQAKISSLMKDIKGFSTDVIEVVIPSSRNEAMIIIDTPGIVYNDKDDRIKIKHIIDRLIENKPRIIGVTSASTTLAANQGIQNLKDMGANEDMIVSRCDKEIESWADPLSGAALCMNDENNVRLWFTASLIVHKGKYTPEAFAKEVQVLNTALSKFKEYGHESRLGTAKVKQLITDIYKRNRADFNNLFNMRVSAVSDLVKKNWGGKSKIDDAAMILMRSRRISDILEQMSNNLADNDKDRRIYMLEKTIEKTLGI